MYKCKVLLVHEAKMILGEIYKLQNSTFKALGTFTTGANENGFTLAHQQP